MICSATVDSPGNRALNANIRRQKLFSTERADSALVFSHLPIPEVAKRSSGQRLQDGHALERHGHFEQVNEAERTQRIEPCQKASLAHARIGRRIERMSERVERLQLLERARDGADGSGV